MREYEVKSTGGTRRDQWGNVSAVWGLYADGKRRDISTDRLKLIREMRRKATRWASENGEAVRIYYSGEDGNTKEETITARAAAERYPN